MQLSLFRVIKEELLILTLITLDEIALIRQQCPASNIHAHLTRQGFKKANIRGFEHQTTDSQSWFLNFKFNLTEEGDISCIITFLLCSENK
jgi:hypothetical protein